LLTFLGENGIDPTQLRKIEETVNLNLPSFTGLEIAINSIKAKVIRSFGEFDTFAVSYNKEANILRDTLEQVIPILDIEKYLNSLLD